MSYLTQILCQSTVKFCLSLEAITSKNEMVENRGITFLIDKIYLITKKIDKSEFQENFYFNFWFFCMKNSS